MAGYRKLTGEEIGKLQAQGCAAADWADIEVADGFDPGRLSGVTFGGRVRLGANTGTAQGADGIARPSGIHGASLIDSTIGDDAFIAGAVIKSYDIGGEVTIKNTRELVCRGESQFGNGVEVKVINEAGGREVTITDRLSAQAAYFTAMYRHLPKFQKAMAGIAEKYCKSVRSPRGSVGDGAFISGCGSIREVKIGPRALLEGALALENGTVNSSGGAPTRIGPGVIARDFICGAGAEISDGAQVERCFVGGACHLGKGFTATDSLFFAGSYCESGEAAAIFAGPYTVSHHKSSLLIAGYFLMFNAGSGANQSNHLFNTGAVHQGIHERGVKFASNAYVMLPAREGAFTTVVGRHRKHHDTAVFPYSTLVESDGQTYLLPASTLGNYGTGRDIAKWPVRDARGPESPDVVNFEEYNPYIGMRLAGAVRLCEEMLAAPKDEYIYKRVRIGRGQLAKGLESYRLALDATIGTILAAGSENKVQASFKWIDAAGMYMPATEVDKLVHKIEKGALESADEIVAALKKLHAAYQDHAYSWALTGLREILEREPSAKDIREAIAKGAKAAAAITKMREANAKYDRSETMTTGYGIDASSPEEIAADFQAVRSGK